MPEKKFRLPTTEFLICTSVRDLSNSKNHRDWAELNAVLLQPLLTMSVVLDGEKSVGELLKTLTTNISERGYESAADESESDITRGTGEENNNKDTKEKAKKKPAMV